MMDRIVGVLRIISRTQSRIRGTDPSSLADRSRMSRTVRASYVCGGGETEARAMLAPPSIPGLLAPQPIARSRRWPHMTMKSFCTFFHSYVTLYRPPLSPLIAARLFSFLALTNLPIAV